MLIPAVLTPAEGNLYREGFTAYDPHRGEAFRQNPFLYGPGRDAQALTWWRGYQAAREAARLSNPRAAS